MVTRIDYVGLASDIKDFVAIANVKFDDIGLRNKIFDTDDNDLLKVTKLIGSNTKIISVDLVDDDFIMKAVLGEN
jgi:hypothetical protein